MICDVAREFVSKNPGQFDKPMRSAQKQPGPPVNVIRADRPKVALAEYLEGLSKSMDGRSEDSPATVFVLGRYRFDSDVMPTRRYDNLHVEFKTIHGSKGLEADHVVLPGMTTGRYGFPSTISDDPVLRLAMPDPESFPDSEERRLLYVALTRARKQVTMIVPTDRWSRFAVELVEDPRVCLAGEDDTEVEVCGTCRRGTMVERRGRYGRFLSCDEWPRCQNKRSLT